MSPAYNINGAPKPRGVAVYCGSSLGKQKAFAQAAISVGAALARDARPLVYGGSSKGIMGIVSESALEHGGEVVGVIPYAMYAAGGERSVPTSASLPETYGWLREKTASDLQNGKDIKVDTQNNDRYTTVIVNSMHERKVEMASRASGFIGLPGGFGTYEEVFEVITWTQLGIHEKPVVLLNVLSFFSPLRDLIRNGVKQGFIEAANESLVVFVDGPQNLSEHETFDWGGAALRALNSWSRSESVVRGPYDWARKIGETGEVRGDNLDYS